MNLMQQLNTVGEYSFFYRGAIGQVEACLSVPEGASLQTVALIGHPHSLQGGTMNNKVVTTLVRVFKELGIASIRINFRGVGQTAGQYDAGVGESEDLVILANHCREQIPGIAIALAGFSFGSYVAWRAATQVAPALLITVAPSVHNYNYSESVLPPSPWVFVQGEEDEIIPAALVTEFVKSVSPTSPLLLFPGTGHFFHGQLVSLRLRLLELIQSAGWLG